MEGFELCEGGCDQGGDELCEGEFWDCLLVLCLEGCARLCRLRLVVALVLTVASFTE